MDDRWKVSYLFVLMSSLRGETESLASVWLDLDKYLFNITKLLAQYGIIWMLEN